MVRVSRAPFGYKDETVMRRLLHTIDGVLQGIGIVGFAVGLGAEVLPV
jgi:hypothetical protein